MFSESDKIPGKNEDESDEEEQPDPPRNFTLSQLKYFDGTKDKDGQDKPVYLSVNTIVFDVTSGRDFYGPDGPYEKFAGRECGVALAKMSFDEALLDNLDGVQDLKYSEKCELEGWIEKFRDYRCYPVKGRYVPQTSMPDPNRIVTKEELAKVAHNVPEGYAAAPIYVGAGDKVYDMSFGGVTFYGKGGPYSKFAGKDASRSLAKMSLDDADFENASTSDLTDKQRKVLQDWIKTFEEKKLYPVVGRLKK